MKLFRRACNDVDQRLDRTSGPKTIRVGLGHVIMWTRDWTGQADERLKG